MARISTFCGVLFICLFLRPVTGQNRSIELPHISISVQKPHNFRQENEKKLDSLALFGADRNLNQGLGGIPGLYLRNYGPSGISTINLRGTGPGHTQICWNGIPLQNPMLGQADASLIAGPMLQGARLESGGAARLSTGENFGGILELGEPASENKPEFLQTGFSAGSFSAFHQWLAFRESLGQCKVSLRSWNQEARNNFRFHHKGKEFEQQHSYRTFRGLEAGMETRIANLIRVESRFWKQYAAREIPPSVHEERSLARQEDESNRMFIRISGVKEHFRIKATLAGTQDLLRYQDPISGIRSESRIQRRFAFMEAEWQNGSWLLGTSGLAGSDHIPSSTYGNTVRQLRWSGLLKAQFSPRSIPVWITTTFRGERLHGNENMVSKGVLLPSVTVEYQTRSWGRFEAGWHRKFRYPSLNDLFWPGAGNPYLEPEKGYNAEIRWKKECSVGAPVSLLFEASGFQSRIRNYIQWLPVNTLWKPSNVGTVEIAGLDLHTGFQVKNGIGKLTLDGGLQICRSALAEERFHGDAAKGKQLIYMPFIQNQVRGQWEAGNFGFSCWLQHTGPRNIDPSGNTRLEAFSLWNARAEHRLKLSSREFLRLFAEGQNLTGTNYQLMAGFPMPGRQFSVGIELKMN